MWIEPPVLPPPEPDELPELPHAARASAPTLASATKPPARLLLYPCCINRVIAPALSLLPLLLSGRHRRCLLAGGQPAAYPPRSMSPSSGRPGSSGPGPSATVSPFTITYAHSACPRARLVFCSTTSTPMPRLRTARMCSQTCPSTRGARPAGRSASSSSVGSA